MLICCGNGERKSESGLTSFLRQHLVLNSSNSVNMSLLGEKHTDLKLLSQQFCMLVSITIMQQHQPELLCSFSRLQQHVTAADPP